MNAGLTMPFFGSLTAATTSGEGSPMAPPFPGDPSLWSKREEGERLVKIFFILFITMVSPQSLYITPWIQGELVRSGHLHIKRKKNESNQGLPIWRASTLPLRVNASVNPQLIILITDNSEYTELFIYLCE